MVESSEGHSFFARAAGKSLVLRFILSWLMFVLAANSATGQFAGTAFSTEKNGNETALPVAPMARASQADNQTDLSTNASLRVKKSGDPSDTALVSYESIPFETDGLSCDCGPPCNSCASCTDQGCAPSACCTSPTCCCTSNTGDGGRLFNRSWASASFLSYWLSDSASPPLVTSGLPGGNINQIGTLGASGTSIIADGGTVAPSAPLGIRVEVGTWLDTQGQLGVQTDLMSVHHQPDGFFQRATSDMPTARPFFNLDTGMQDSQVLSAPGVSEGSVAFVTDLDIFSSGVAVVRNWSRFGDSYAGSSTDLIAGYRYFGLKESFSAHEVLRPAAASFVPGTQFDLRDDIETDNNFHGIELGGRQRWSSPRWLCDLSATCALGQATSRAALSGSTQQFVPGLLDSTTPGGFLVPTENVGVRRDRSFALLPQVRATLGYRLSNAWFLSAGYDFSYLSDAYRAGDLLTTTFRGSDLGLGSSTTSPTPTPSPQGVFLHGISLGVNGVF